MADPATNTFKRGLAEARKQIGFWLGLGDSLAAEIVAGAGFDWVLIDEEHGPNDLRSILAQVQAIAAYPAHAVVRPPIGATEHIKQLLDIGVQSLLVPMVETAEQAAALVAAMRYPPHGVRGVGSAIARSSRWSRIGTYLQHADKEMCLVVQVETMKGLRNLEAIAAIEGVDGLFIGPADLSASMGRLGDPGHPDVRAAIDGAVRRIRTAGKPVGSLTGDAELARHWFEQGMSFMAVGADVTALGNAASAACKTFKEIAAKT
jgi:4-hydroxy-2-oxoheptanedioate aldolase